MIQRGFEKNVVLDPNFCCPVLVYDVLLHFDTFVQGNSLV